VGPDEPEPDVERQEHIAQSFVEGSGASMAVTGSGRQAAVAANKVLELSKSTSSNRFTEFTNLHYQHSY
jgi:hypothetical protein